jgi:methionyl-tRNA formyltransferase
MFFGTSPFAETVLRGLLASEHEVVAVAAAADRPAGRGRKTRPGPVSALVRQMSIPLLQPETLRARAVRDQLAQIGADVFAVASYGLIFPKAALAIPRFGAVNAHASVLPLLRGAAPVERAILAGLTETGVSIQQMVRRVDAGDVYAMRATAIAPADNAASLRERLAAIAAELLPQVLTRIEAGSACAMPQDDAHVTHAPPLAPGERAILWSEDAEVTERRTRAFGPKPGAFALMPEELQRRRINLLEVEVVPPEGHTDAPGGTVVAAGPRDGLLVRAGAGVLRLKTVQPEGKRPMAAEAFVRGHPMRAGMRFLDGTGAQRPHG